MLDSQQVFIQIQLLLKLNFGISIVIKSILKIQIQLLLKLNNPTINVEFPRKNNSNTTLVKVK